MVPLVNITVRGVGGSVFTLVHAGSIKIEKKKNNEFSCWIKLLSCRFWHFHFVQQTCNFTPIAKILVLRIKSQVISYFIDSLDLLLFIKTFKPVLLWQM